MVVSKKGTLSKSEATVSLITEMVGLIAECVAAYSHVPGKHGKPLYFANLKPWYC